jgi:acid phosphatase
MVFDVDYTLLMPTKQGYTGINEMIELANWVKDRNISLAIITGRLESMRSLTIKELQSNGILMWDLLIMRPMNMNDLQVYKTNARKDVQDGYCGGRSCIIANIGDQDSDLQGGYSHYTFKLPAYY